MSTSVPPRDGGALSGTSNSPTSYLGDDSALRRVFDAEYDPLVTAARSQLGDAASQAPRIVETAFVSAWTQRASLQSGEQVKTFLTEEVQHGASRALSRRAAAQRFGSHGGRDGASAGAHAADAGPANAGESWEHITRAIHQSDDHGPDAHAALANAGRHEAAAHMKKVGRGQSWVGPVVIGVVALVVSVAAVMYTSRLGEDDATYSAVNSPAIEPITSSPGQIGTTTLSDGTKMRMGPETKFMKPDGFPTTMRAVKIDGTAQFDVAPGQPLPFRVIAKHTQIVATGTSFVVSAFQSDSGVMVLVKEGSVAVKSGKQTTTVAANQALLIDGNTSRALTDDERAQAFGWTDGRIVVTHKQLRYVVAQLTRWFNLDVKVPDLSLLDRDASINVSLDSSLVAINQVEKSANVKFGYEGETKVFKDATPKK
jgi:ferric-dicitrate binding protein FerR (iron transport regulator)